MKYSKILLPILLVFATSSVFAQEKTESIKVYGECGMCKKRIQQALKLDGINTAVWDTETKMLAVSDTPQTISIDEIEKKIAAAGHDTQKYKAPDSVYAKFPGCCHYERKKDDSKLKTHH